MVLNPRWFLNPGLAGPVYGVEIVEVEYVSLILHLFVEASKIERRVGSYRKFGTYVLDILRRMSMRRKGNRPKSKHNNSYCIFIHALLFSSVLR